MSTLAEQAGAVIREARGDRSQRAVARALGIAASTLNELELGNANPTLERLERVAQGLGIRLAVVRAGRDGGVRVLRNDAGETVTVAAGSEP